MNKITWYDAIDYMKAFNKKHNITSKSQNGPKCTIIAVISPKSFEIEYSLEERSYAFTNYNGMFIDTTLDSSIYADSLDGTDPGVRLDYYTEWMWQVEYCYIQSED